MNRLRAFWPLFLLVAVSSCSSSSSPSPSASQEAGAGGSAPSGRTVPTCAQVIGGLVPEFGTADPGWSTIPVELQKLPAGATFCGSVVTSEDAGLNLSTAIVITDLWGQDLANFYGPLLTSAGCSLGQPDLLGKDQARVFTCGSGQNAVSGSITASGTWTFVEIMY